MGVFKKLQKGFLQGFGYFLLFHLQLATTCKNLNKNKSFCKVFANLAKEEILLDSASLHLAESLGAATRQAGGKRLGGILGEEW